MGILTTCEELFGTTDLYQVLGVEKTASSGQIKKAYHKMSLQVHPDRVGETERESCTRKFQCVGAVYAVLSDQERRGLYDETGEVEDEMDPLQDKDKDWEEYWRLHFPKISVQVLLKAIESNRLICINYLLFRILRSSRRSTESLRRRGKT